MSAVAVYYLDGVDFYANSEERDAINQAGRDLLISLGYKFGPEDEVTAETWRGEGEQDVVSIQVAYSGDNLRREGFYNLSASVGYLSYQPQVQPIVEAIRKLPRQAS